MRDDAGLPVLVREGRLPNELPVPDRTDYGQPERVAADHRRRSSSVEGFVVWNSSASNRRSSERDLVKNQLWPKYGSVGVGVSGLRSAEGIRATRRCGSVAQRGHSD